MPVPPSHGVNLTLYIYINHPFSGDPIDGTPPLFWLLPVVQAVQLDHPNDWQHHLGLSINGGVPQMDGLYIYIYKTIYIVCVYIYIYWLVFIYIYMWKILLKWMISRYPYFRNLYLTWYQWYPHENPCHFQPQRFWGRWSPEHGVNINRDSKSFRIFPQKCWFYVYVSKVLGNTTIAGWFHGKSWKIPNDDWGYPHDLGNPFGRSPRRASWTSWRTFWGFH